MTKLKLLFVIPDLRFGGTNSSLSNIYTAISKDYDIYIYSLYNKKIGNYSFNDKVVKSGRLIYFYYCYLSDLNGREKIIAFIVKLFSHLCLLLSIPIENIIQKREINQLSINNNFNLVVGFQEGAATKFASRFNGYKKIAWIHCDYARYFHLYDRDEETMYSLFDKIVCVSEYTAQSFCKIYPEIKDKVISIYNLYDKERVVRLSQEADDDYRFDNSLFTILSVGRIDSVKRFSLIPSIAKKIKEKGKLFKWYIIGNVVEEKEYKALLDNIKSNGVEDVVVPLGGKKNPYPFFAKSSLFVTTSSSEACPIVFLEAQTFDVPIVSTDFGSSSEFIEYGVNGYISSLEFIHRSIIDIMNGNLKYKQIDKINNEVIINQIQQEINELFE